MASKILDASFVIVPGQKPNTDRNAIRRPVMTLAIPKPPVPKPVVEEKKEEQKIVPETKTVATQTEEPEEPAAIPKVQPDPIDWDLLEDAYT